MSLININNCDYYYEVHGSGLETIVLSHGLLWSGKMYFKQVEYFKSKYKVITYDHRGQGKSEVCKGGYDMDSLYDDTVKFLEKLNLKKVHFGGLSMGGFVAMRLAARRPDLVKSLILMETSAFAEPNVIKYRFLSTMVKVFGVKAVLKPVMNIMFGDKFLNDPERKEEKESCAAEILKNKKTVVRAVNGVIDRKPIDNELQNISCPTLILVGTQDKATVPKVAEIIHSKINNSILKYIDGAGHTACIEEPDKYNLEIDLFLRSINT